MSGTAGFLAGRGGWADSGKADRTGAPLLRGRSCLRGARVGWRGFCAGTASWRRADSTSGATFVTLAAATSGGGRSRTVTLIVRRGGPGARHCAGVGGSHRVGPVLRQDGRHRAGGRQQRVMDDGGAERLLEAGAGQQLLPVERRTRGSRTGRGAFGPFSPWLSAGAVSRPRRAARTLPSAASRTISMVSFLGKPAEQGHHDQRYKASQPGDDQREHDSDEQADEHEEGHTQRAEKGQVQCNRCRIFHFTLLTTRRRPSPDAGDYAGQQPLTTIRTIYCRHARMASPGGCCFEAVIGRGPPAGPIVRTSKRPPLSRDAMTQPRTLFRQLPVPLRRAVRRLLRPVPQRIGGRSHRRAADAFPLQRLRPPRRRLPPENMASRTPGPPSWTLIRGSNGGGWTSCPSSGAARSTPKAQWSSRRTSGRTASAGSTTKPAASSGWTAAGTTSTPSSFTGSGTCG